MANKTKKVSINAFESVVKAMDIHEESVQWNGLDIVIKPVIGLREMLVFVREVTQSCFTDEDNEYMPEVKDFAVKSCLIEHYTNLALPSNTEKRYELIYMSNIADVILEHVNKSQISEIIGAIDARIEHLSNVNIEAMNRQINELYAAFENLQNNFGDVLSSVSAEDLKGLTSALVDGRFDENKIIEAYLNHKAHASDLE